MGRRRWNRLPMPEETAVRILLDDDTEWIGWLCKGRKTIYMEGEDEKRGMCTLDRVKGWQKLEK